MHTPNQEFVSSNDDEKADRLLTCLDSAKKNIILAMEENDVILPVTTDVNAKVFSIYLINTVRNLLEQYKQFYLITRKRLLNLITTQKKD